MGSLKVAERLERLPFTKWHWGIIGIALLIWLTEAIDIGLTGATIPSLKSYFHLVGAEIGAIASLSTLGIIISLFFSGVAIDYFGKRKTLIIGMFLFGLTTSLTAFSTNIATVILLRFLAGIGMGMVFTIPYQMVAELVPAKYRGYSIGSINAVLNLGYFVNLVVAAAVIPSFGWRPMYLFGGVSLVALILVYFRMPESPRWLEAKGRYREADELLNQIEEKVKRYWNRPLPPIPQGIPVFQERAQKGVPVGELFRGQLLKRTIVLWVTTSCLWSTWYLFALYLPVMLKMQGYQLGNALMTAAIVNAAPIPITLFGAWLLERIGRKATIALYAALSMTGVSIFSISHDYYPALAGASIAFGFMAAAFSFTKLFSAEQYPTRIRGTGTAWMEAVGRGGAGVLIPMLLATVLAQSGIFPACAIVLGLGIVGLLVFVAAAQETRGLVLEQLDPRLSVSTQIDGATSKINDVWETK
jgi:MFS transporter, putative metabolite:H+ symporter